MPLTQSFDEFGRDNNMVQAVVSSGSALLRAIGVTPEQGKLILKETQTLRSAVSKFVWPDISLNDMVGNNYRFVRLAGLSGTTAILMAAYCSYALDDIKDPMELMRSEAYADVAIRMHLWHAFAMMALPLAHYPVLTGTLMTTGTLIYSGVFYYCALTGKRRVRNYSTIGGFFLIAAWMSLAL